jgi:hypothetical protein
MRRWLTGPWVRTSFTNNVSSPYDSSPVADDLEARGPVGGAVGGLLDTVGGILGGLPLGLGPLLQDTLKKVGDTVSQLEVDAASTESVPPSINEESMAEMKKAVADASSAMQSCLPIPVLTPAAGLLPRDDSVADPSSSSSSDPSSTSDSLSPSATETPAAPPNTPVPSPPEHREVPLPIQPPVSLPIQPPASLPIQPPVSLPMQPPVKPPVDHSPPGAQNPASAAGVQDSLPIPKPVPVDLPIPNLPIALPVPNLPVPNLPIALPNVPQTVPKLPIAFPPLPVGRRDNLPVVLPLPATPLAGPTSAKSSQTAAAGSPSSSAAPER